MAILVTLYVVAVGVAAFAWRRARKRAHVRKAARSILQSFVKHSPAIVEHQVLTPDRISPVLQDQVGAATRELERFGFRLVCPYESVSFSKSSGKFIPQWYYVTDGPRPIGATVFYYPSLERSIVSCETDLSDGRIILTTNASAATKHLARPEQFDVEILPEATLQQIVELHGTRLTARLETQSELVPHAPRTADELFESDRRKIRLLRDYRRSIGFVTQDQLIGLVKGGDDFARQVYKEIKVLLEAGFDPFA